MKTIKNSKDITTLEVGDKVVFGNLEYKVCHNEGYFLNIENDFNNKIFTVLNIDRKDFVESLGIATLSYNWIFPETKSLEALTAIVSALFKEYEKQNELPKTWEEFCERNNITWNESYIDLSSRIQELAACERDSVTDRNVCTSIQEAEAFTALMQLRQLRKCYIGDWKPNWNIPESKYVIKIIGGNCFQIIEKDFEISPLSFPTYELTRQFLTNFNNLLEIAKPLL